MEYVHGNKKVFDDFVNNITSQDKIALISHNDVDGIVSAFLLHEFLLKKGFNVALKKFMTYKKDFMGDLIKELKENGITIICITDLQVDSDDFEGYCKLSGEIKTLLLDHHPLHNDKNAYLKLNVIKCVSTNCTGYMVYNLCLKLLNEKYYEDLMLACLISDYCFKDEKILKLINNKYKGVNKNNAFDSIPGILAKKLNSYLVFSGKNYDNIWNILKNRDLIKLDKTYDLIENEIQKSYEYYLKHSEFFPKFNLYFLHYTPKYNYTSTLTTILTKKDKDATFILLSDVANDHSKIKISSRNQNATVQMNKLLEESVKNLDNSISGGHISAAGGTIMRKDTKKFKENLFKYFESLKHN